jgi:broad-specificity NMP kinase
MIVHINGYPGVGKVTISRELVELIGDCQNDGE